MATRTKRSETDLSKRSETDLSKISAAAVRGFLHQSAEFPVWSIEDLMKALDVDQAQAKGVAAAMQISGYIEAVGAKFRNTDAGNAVAKVSKAKPIKRATAGKALEEFLGRVRTANLESEYLYAVERAVLFGPYLEGAEKIKDVDVAVELVPKERSKSKLEAREKKQAEEAESAGKRFKSFADRRAWGHNKVFEFLKGRTRALSVCLLTDDILARPHKPVYTRGASPGHR